MTREEITKIILESKADNFILELSTGVGKTKVTLDKINQWYNSNKQIKILICIPKLVLISNWKAEIEKFNYSYLLDNITFTTYASFHKHTGEWDVLVLDEAHHLSERCKTFIPAYKVKHTLFLSATLKQEFRWWISQTYKSVEHVIVGIKKAIESNILPEFKVVLLPLTLDGVKNTHIIKKNAKNKGDLRVPINVPYKDRWKYKQYSGAYNLICTQKQYYEDLSSLIEWYKKRAEYNKTAKRLQLYKSNERLKWLSEQKTPLIKEILYQLRNFRVLTFSGGIEQSKKLNKPCVNSKIGTKNLELFNNHKIKHIVAVSQLDEGVNLSECKIILFQMINASHRLIIQRIGRGLRHKAPVLIFPYFKNTREVEIVRDIISGYPPENILTFDTINGLVSTICNI